MDQLIRCAAVLALLLVLCGCDGARRDHDRVSSPPRPQRHPNVLLVTLDTTRADRIGSYGFGLARTPALDSIAREGVRVTHAVAVAPLTAPSHASMLTGLYPAAHGVRDNGSYRLRVEHRAVAEAFHDAGYGTFAFVSAVVLDRRYGLDQGFDVYDDSLGDEADPEMFMFRERRGDRTVACALEALREHVRATPGKPFFVWVHLFDVHQPTAAPSSERLRSPTPYDAEIAYVDQHVATLIDGLRTLGVYDTTATLVTADHGESLGEHGESTHGYFAYEATMHVPMLLRAPFLLPSGYVFDGNVSGVDVAPTLLALAGLYPLAGVQGRSLVRSIVEREPLAGRLVFSEAKLTELGFGMAPLFAVRDDRFTFVRAPRSESVSTPAESPLIDPKDGREVYEMLEQTRQLARGGDWVGAGARARAALRIAPRNVSGLNLLALAATRSGRPADAARAYEASLAIVPEQPRVHMMLGQLALEARKPDHALDSFARALSLMPGLVDAQLMRAVALQVLHRDAEAERYLRGLLAASTEPARLHRMIGELAFERGDYASAVTSFEAAVASTPRSAPAHHALALALHRRGDDTAALRAADRAISLESERWEYVYDRACILATLGRVEEALAGLSSAIERGFDRPQAFDTDPDLETLRTDARFRALRARVARRASNVRSQR